MSAFPSDAAIGAAERAAHERELLTGIPSVLCIDCCLAVPMAEGEFGAVPVDGVFDGDDVVHNRCYAKRCHRCGMPLGVGCSHRDRFSNAHAPQRVSRDRRVLRGAA